jgi:hypothetical protein
MFNIFDYLEVHKNPLLASEFIKIVPAFELVKHVLETKENEKYKKILNNKAIKDGILNSNRDDLKLILATYGEVLELWDSKDFFKLYEKGPSFKAALFSNSNIDWYKLNDTDKVEILHKSLCANLEDETNKNLIFAIVSNPRTDRKVIANAMLGVDGFEELPLTTRFLIAAKAIKVEPIEAEHWSGKDSPDSHEIYFSNVNEAFLPMIKDAKNEMAEVEFETNLNVLLWELPYAKLDIQSEHWLSINELDSLQVEFTNMRRYIDNIYKIKKIALTKVFEFFEDWYQEKEGYPQTAGQISRVGVPILAITSLLRNYWLRDDAYEITLDLLSSPSLILRAAGYATIFDNISVESESGEISEFFDMYPDNTLEKWIGITSIPAFWLCDSYGSNDRFIAQQMKASGFIEEINIARNDMYKYLFLHSFSENLEKHNLITKLDLKRQKSKVESDRPPFTVDETKLFLNKPEKSFLQKLFD